MNKVERFIYASWDDREREGRRKSLFQERWMSITRRQFVKMLALLIFRTESSQGLKRNKKRMFREARKRISVKSYGKKSFPKQRFLPLNDCHFSTLALFCELSCLASRFSRSERISMMSLRVVKALTAFRKWKALTASLLALQTRIFDYVRLSLSLEGNAGDADCEPLQHFSRHSIPVLFLTLHAPPSFRKTPKYVTLPRLPHFAPHSLARLSTTRYEW